MSALEYKNAGNKAFSSGDMTTAIQQYSYGINAMSHSSTAQSSELVELHATLLTNRAACYLRKSSEYPDMDSNALKACINDCTRAIDLRPQTVKAYYRRAQAHMSIQDAPSAVRDLTQLLHIDPKNTDAISLLRQAKDVTARDHTGLSDVQRILRRINTCLQDGSRHEDIHNLLRALLGLCADDESHAREFVRHEGISLLCGIGTNHGEFITEGRSILSTILSVFCAACNYPAVVMECVSLNFSIDARDATDDKKYLRELNDNGKLSLQKMCVLVSSRWGADVANTALTTVMRVLRAQPLSKTVNSSAAKDKFPLGVNDSRVEELLETDSGTLPEPPRQDILEPFLSPDITRCVFQACVTALRGSDTELFALACDALVALWSETADYFTAEPAVDSRMETLESRKSRMRRLDLCLKRSRRNAQLALDEHVFDCLVLALDRGSALERSRALSSFGRLVNAVEDVAAATLRRTRKKEDPEPEEDTQLKSLMAKYLAPDDTPPLQAVTLRGALTGALLIAKPALGVWALKQTNGMNQVLYLISTGDTRCQDIAAEVICLAASVDGGQELLANALQSGAVHSLLRSPHPGIRAAAASAITKLSLRAKALQEESPEVSSVLNAALDVLRVYKEKMSSATSAVDSLKEKDTHVSRSPAPLNTNLDVSINTASSLASAERAVEVVAAMIGRTHVKEEIVHGSYRVAAAIPLLCSLELDARSTAAYGLAHIFAALTVTNRELHSAALAAKDMTSEQYDQLQELQRIKGVKDENGNIIEEKKDSMDSDTDVFCRARIKRIVQIGCFPCLIRLLTFGSAQTRECTARAMRQICVEETVRGLFIQQGALKACCTLAANPNVALNGVIASALTLREAAHAVAKSLITTNPSLLQGHARLGAFQPLIALARDVDATNLQQFEALLALTNLVSLGEAEQSKFVQEKGVACAHYLMFSDHLMVRRAASEVFCNCPTEEKVLILLRDPEKVRLWVGLCEDWANEESSEESYLIARACCGTLAIAAQDLDVCKALLKEKIGSAVTHLLESEKPELIHRALALVESLVETGGKECALHLLEHSCVPGIGAAHKVVQDNPNLVALAQRVAQLLSTAIKMI
jgi:hypothetical protein